MVRLPHSLLASLMLLLSVTLYPVRLLDLISTSLNQASSEYGTTKSGSNQPGQQSKPNEFQETLPCG